MHSAQTPLPLNSNDEPGMMSWLDHLRELRSRLIKASLAVVVGLILGFFVVTYDNYLLISLIADYLTPEGVTLQATESAEVFTNAIRVALAIGVGLAMPVIVYQLLAFIVPGLTSRERQIIFLILPFITICFVAGLVFGWFVTVPAAFNFLLRQGLERFTIEPKVGDFLSLFTRLMLLNGVLFEMPVIVYSLIWLGAVQRETLTRYRRYAVLVIVIISAIVTPTSDPVNLALVAIPMYLLYELGLLLALVAPRRKTVVAGR
ncbi:MAG TPA: twin-arginine translocase subunit TatC [Herpetosiphonaceae bacterium]